MLVNRNIVHVMGGTVAALALALAMLVPALGLALAFVPERDAMEVASSLLSDPVRFILVSLVPSLVVYLWLMLALWAMTYASAASLGTLVSAASSYTGVSSKGYLKAARGLVVPLGRYFWLHLIVLLLFALSWLALGSYASGTGAALGRDSLVYMTLLMGVMVCAALFFMYIMAAGVQGLSEIAIKRLGAWAALKAALGRVWREPETAMMLAIAILCWFIAQGPLFMPALALWRLGYPWAVALWCGAWALMDVYLFWLVVASSIAAAATGPRMFHR